MRCLPILLAVSLILPLPALASGQNDGTADDTEPPKKKSGSRFIDPEDGKLDLTAASDKGAGFFPLALPFNEPATGIGLAVALGYFHGSKATVGSTPNRPKPPPTTTFGAGAYTQNGSWLGALGHQHVWNGGRVRYFGAILTGSVNLKFYGFGDSDSGQDNGIEFNIKLNALIQQGKVQLGKSRFFTGGRYVYANTDTTFKTTLGPIDGKTVDAGVTWLNEYDSRDTTMTPSRGIFGSVDVSYFGAALGGDFDYGSVQTKFRYYWPLANKWVLGFRGDFDVAGDDAPFYALPFVKLRGVPAFRYLGNYLYTVEAEPRYLIDQRWSVLAFAGTGRASTESDKLLDAEFAYSYGAGFRYLIARKLGLGAGIDIARGPEDTVGYLTVGSTW